MSPNCLIFISTGEAETLQIVLTGCTVCLTDNAILCTRFLGSYKSLISNVAREDRAGDVDAHLILKFFKNFFFKNKKKKNQSINTIGCAEDTVTTI